MLPPHRHTGMPHAQDLRVIDIAIVNSQTSARFISACAFGVAVPSAVWAARLLSEWVLRIGSDSKTVGRAVTLAPHRHADTAHA
jgi:hypothetical protein